MRLKEIMQKTGLNKRTIHFYIEEHFLTPKIDPSNGYYIFSEEDVERLKCSSSFAAPIFRSRTFMRS